MCKHANRGRGIRANPASPPNPADSASPESPESPESPPNPKSPASPADSAGSTPPSRLDGWTCSARTYLLVFSGIVFFGTVLLVLSFCLPRAAMVENVREDLEPFRFVSAPESLAYEATWVDRYTDAGMLLEAIYEPAGDPSPVEQALLVTGGFYDNDNVYTTRLASYLDGEEVAYEEAYARYWHGYLAILAPLLLLFNYSDRLVLMGFVQIALLCLIVYELATRNRAYLAAPFVFAWMSLVPAVASACFQYLTVHTLTMLACLAVIVFYDRLDRTRSLPLLFMAVGMLVNYFDYLTYPLVSLGVPLVLATACVQSQGRSVKAVLARLLACSVAWFAGYAGMWASKWLIAFLLTGYDAFGEALRQIVFRSSSAAGYSVQGAVEGQLGYSAVVQSNTDLLKKPAFAAWFVLFLAYLAFDIVKTVKVSGYSGVRPLRLVAHAVPYLAIAVLPFIWMFATKNHTFMHHFFTFRMLSVSVMALLVAPASLNELARSASRYRPQAGQPPQPGPDEGAGRLSGSA